MGRYSKERIVINKNLLSYDLKVGDKVWLNSDYSGEPISNKSFDANEPYSMHEVIGVFYDKTIRKYLPIVLVPKKLNESKYSPIDEETLDEEMIDPAWHSVDGYNLIVGGRYAYQKVGESLVPEVKKSVKKSTAKKIAEKKERIIESIKDLRVGDKLVFINRAKEAEVKFRRSTYVGFDPWESRLYSLYCIRSVNGVLTKAGIAERDRAKWGLKVGDVIRYQGFYGEEKDTVSYFDAYGFPRNKKGKRIVEDPNLIITTDSKLPSREVPDVLMKDLEDSLRLPDKVIDIETDSPPQSQFIQETTSAAYRIAAHQSISLTKSALITLLESKGHSSESLQKMTEMLDTEFGRSILAMTVGYGFSQFQRENPKVQRFAKECRVNGLTAAGNEIFSTVVKAVMDVFQNQIKEEEEENPLLIIPMEESEPYLTAMSFR